MSFIRSLVIYYSLEDSTRMVAEAIAEEVGADVVALRPNVEPRATGFCRYLLYGWQRITHPRVRIAPLELDPRTYDLLFIGTPVWASQPAPAVQTLLRTTRLADQHVALFCTHKGGPGETLALMEKAVSGATVVGRLDVANVQVEKATALARATAWALRCGDFPDGPGGIGHAMTDESAHVRIANWRRPDTGPALERAETMVEPAILAGVFGDSCTLAVCGLQYHLGGAEDTRELADLAGITASDHMLDVACFVGGPALQLAENYGCRVTGIDHDPKVIAGARRIAQLAGLEPLLQYVVADAAHMPFPDASCTVIWNQGSLNHDPAWLREFDRVLRPGGRLALVSEIRPEGCPLPQEGGRWTRAETASRIAALGFNIRDLEDLTEREITLGWERMIRRLDERRDIYLVARGAEWIETARKEFREEIAAMRRLEWSNARLIAVKPQGTS